MCEQIHNEYAVARLKNILLSQHFSLQIDATGQIPRFLLSTTQHWQHCLIRFLLSYRRVASSNLHLY